MAKTRTRPPTRQRFRQLGANPFLEGGKIPIAGICAVCGCTDEDGCPEGCSWITKDHTLCSVCAARLGVDQAMRDQIAWVLTQFTEEARGKGDQPSVIDALQHLWERITRRHRERGGRGFLTRRPPEFIEATRAARKAGRV